MLEHVVFTDIDLIPTPETLSDPLPSICAVIETLLRLVETIRESFNLSHRSVFAS
ncbi:hypothetical protein [Allorhodopirellula solitaria]|uniref:hypothetical protein n=1 Tax=Allorhodopirellula solitaria TaxID=2527987 RepID=UPI001C950B40|nr:hypothetical protein [Allorhodopirellula solitaria]